MDNFLFSYPTFLVWLPLLAVVLDLLLGDPSNFPHPVRFIGYLLERMEKFFLHGSSGRLHGVAALLAVLVITGALVSVCVTLPGILGAIAAIYFSYAGLALGCLVHEGRKAANAISSGSIDDGRKAVSMLVSRDVSKLGPEELYRTLAETLGENFNDAFVAPLFWLFCTGPVGLWVYKAASTGDSCWGYRHEPWANFGWAAARLDDVLAYIPARLSACFLFFSAAERSNWPGFSAIAAQAKSMESPNAGWSMAAAAWLHNGSMGGKAVYAGEVKEKPLLGPENADWDAGKIESLLQHLPKAGLCSLVCIWFVFMAIFVLLH